MLPELARRADEGIRRPVGDLEGLILESWSQGFMVGALICLICITIANMRRRVLLHKLILAEVSRPSRPTWSQVAKCRMI